MTWPRLTETLRGPRHPGACQACGRTHASSNPLTRWQECDDADKKELRVVVLCKSCADSLIEPHPRLYHELPGVWPWPGCMGVCADCRHRQELRCTSPLARINGGTGLEYQPAGSMVHLCLSPRRLSGWHYIAESPVKKCSGFEAASIATPDDGTR